MNSWKVILATLVIFGAGVVTGGLLVSHVVQGNPRPAAGRPNGQPGNPWHAQSRELLRRMDRELTLSREQREHIEKIITESQERTKFLWKPIAPQMAREMQSVREQMRDELNLDQRKKFDELVRPHPLRKGEDPAKDDRDHRARAQHRNSLTNPPTAEESMTNAPPQRPPATNL